MFRSEMLSQERMQNARDNPEDFYEPFAFIRVEARMYEKMERERS